VKYELCRDDGSQMPGFEDRVFDSMDQLRAFIQKLNAELNIDGERMLFDEGMYVREVPPMPIIKHADGTHPTT
jgi:hypothetical protein